MSLPRYPKYKDSGVEWLGDVPAQWNVSKVKTIIKAIDSGVSVNAVDTPANHESIGVLKTSCVYDGTFRFEENKAVLDEELSRVACPVEKSTIIVSRMNTPALVGAAGLVKESRPNLFLPDRLWQVHFKDCLPDFVHYWTLSPAYRCQVDIACSGTSSSMQNLGRDQFKSFWIPLPTLNEQSAIATFLDRETAEIDALIVKERELLALLAEKRQATISRAVTRGLDPDAALKDSGIPWLGEVPAHWRVTRLRYVARVGNGSTPNRDNPDYWAEEGFPWVNSSVVNLDEVTQAERFVTELALKECHLPIVEPPALLVGITGQGKTRGMATTLKFRATVNQHLAYICPDETELLVPFLLRVLEMAYNHLRTESDAAGSTKGAITCEQLRALEVPLPKLEEQLEIASFLNQEIIALESLSIEGLRGIELLKERRSALISAAVTGKIDVRGLAKRLSA
jgi:type I restriction enzyme S subunit